MNRKRLYLHKGSGLIIYYLKKGRKCPERCETCNRWLTKGIVVREATQIGSLETSTIFTSDPEWCCNNFERFIAFDSMEELEKYEKEKHQ